MPARTCALALLVLASALSLPSATVRRAQAASGTVHALLINGGRAPAQNFLSHLQHLQELTALIRQRGVDPAHIHIFSADGEEPAADMATRSTAPSNFWLVEGTTVGKRLKPPLQLVDTPWRDVTRHPARLENLRGWFDSARTTIQPGDKLLVFVTDHGGRGNRPENGTIHLWNEQITVRELRGLLDRLASRVQVVTVMSQCYSGAFAELMYDRLEAEPSGDTCGFFSTSADEKAYGCYPEGQDRDRSGYAFEFIDALTGLGTTADAHARTLVSDDTPDQPRKTSEIYLARVLSRAAASRKQTVEELADSLIAVARRRPQVFEPQARLLDAIAGMFGTFSPRSLRELASMERELRSQAGQAKEYADRWNAALVEVEELLVEQFLTDRPDWRPRLQASAINGLSISRRTALTAQFLDDLEAFARQADVWPKIERYRGAARAGATASWRFEVRKAAAERMRTALLAIAGRELLDQNGGSDQRRALRALVACEALSLGAPAGDSLLVSRAANAFPLVADDLDVIRQIQPSWLGVRQGQVAQALRTAVPSVAHGTQLQGVETGSPAADAGLKAGDVILGPPDQPFSSSQQLRLWTTTAPRDVDLPLRVFRPATDAQPAQELEVVVRLRPYPEDRFRAVVAPREGAAAPSVTEMLKPRRPNQPLPDVRGRAHVLFFWATWCGFCKAAVPEVLAFAAERGLPVLAITDEDESTVSKFLESWNQPFFESIALDHPRKTFAAHGVSGTPTIVLVDEAGVIRQRAVGYSRKDGLKIPGWRWSAR